MPNERPEFLFDEEQHVYLLDGVQIPSVTDICSTLKTYAAENSAMIRQAARRGSLVHEYCELVDYGCDTDGIQVEPELSPYVLAYMRFCRDYKPEWACIEHRLYSERFRFAGTLDRFGAIDGKAVILDITTTSNPDKATKVSWCCQLAGYSILLGNPEAELWVVRLGKSGKYSVLKAAEIQEKYHFDAFSLFHMLREIKQLIG